MWFQFMDMKKRGGAFHSIVTLAIFIFIILILIWLFQVKNSLITGKVIVGIQGGGTKYSVNQSVEFLYNITVNNTDPGQNANITQVNITIPVNFSFVGISQGTNAIDSVFTSTTSVLSWTNSSNYLINGSEVKNFWFKANSTQPGNYTFTITSVNSTTASSSTIDVEILYVNTTVIPPCAENWTCTNYTSCINNTQNRTCIDLNNCNTTINKPSVSQSCTIPTCSQNWTCTNWSECLGGTQIRVCIDTKNCGNSTGKPAENQTCIVVTCTPSWGCTGWQPPECSKNKTQSRTCTDSNNCGDIIGKPAETQTCAYVKKKDSTWIFITIVIAVFIIIAVVVSLIIKFSKRDSEVYEVTEEYPQYY